MKTLSTSFLRYSATALGFELTAPKDNYPRGVGFDLRDDRGSSGCVAADDNDPHAVAGEMQGDLLAQAGGGAGHQGGERRGGRSDIGHGGLPTD